MLEGVQRILISGETFLIIIKLEVPILVIPIMHRPFLGSTLGSTQIVRAVDDPNFWMKSKTNRSNTWIISDQFDFYQSTQKIIWRTYTTAQIICLGLRSGAQKWSVHYRVWPRSVCIIELPCYYLALEIYGLTWQNLGQICHFLGKNNTIHCPKMSMALAKWHLWVWMLKRGLLCISFYFFIFTII